MTDFEEQELFEVIIFSLASSAWGEDKTSAQIENKAHEMLDKLNVKESKRS